MGTTSNLNQKEINGEIKETLEVVFSNGALAQLKELAQFYKKNNESDLINFAIAVLQGAKNEKEKSVDNK